MLTSGVNSLVREGVTVVHAVLTVVHAGLTVVHLNGLSMVSVIPISVPVMFMTRYEVRGRLVATTQ